MGGMAQVDQWAKDQFGVVSRQQLGAAGLGRSSIAWKVSTGELERVHELVFRLRGAPPIWERKAMEGLFIAGDDSALSHRTAAWMHGLDGFQIPKVIDVSVGRIGPRQVEGYRFHRSRRGSEPVLKRGLPLTRVERTLVDLAADIEPEALEIALDSAQRQYRQLGHWLDTCIAGMNPQATPGLPALIELVKLRRDGVTDSALEVRVLRALRRTGFPPPSPKPVEVFDGPTYVMRLDFAWPAHQVAVHVDGYRWHHQRERADRDARQRSRLHVLGWRTVTVTSTTFAEGTWLNDLRALLRSQGELALR